MTEYSCKPAPMSGAHAFIVTLDFDDKRWVGDRWQRGIRGLYRLQHDANARPLYDSDHLVRAIAELEALALREQPPQEKLAS